MRRFLDERGFEIDEAELLTYFDENKDYYISEYGADYDFEKYLIDCTDKNGTLEQTI